MKTKKRAKKKNAIDGTLRNVRASHTRDDSQNERIAALEKELLRLWDVLFDVLGAGVERLIAENKNKKRKRKKKC